MGIYLVLLRQERSNESLRRRSHLGFRLNVTSQSIGMSDEKFILGTAAGNFQKSYSKWTKWRVITG